MSRLPAFLLLLPISLCFLGCSEDEDWSAYRAPPSELEFAALTGVNLAEMTRTSTGLYWKDIVVGTGDEAQPGGWVTVHYTGWLHDGTVFDTSVGGDPVRFPLTGVIAGWQEGVPGMKVGGKRKLVIPPSLGYGSHPYGGIPGNSTLVFDVELIGVG